MENHLPVNKTELVEDQPLIQLIVFIAGNEEFGVPIDSVREIIKVGAITPIPDSPGYIKGIINVRGEIVTALDIKKRFSLTAKKNVEIKHIIVTKQEDGLFGLMVDEVIEVLRIKQSEIKPPPALITKIHKKYVTGVVTHDERLIILLDLAKVLAQKDLLISADDTKNLKLKNKVKEEHEIVDEDSANKH